MSKPVKIALVSGGGLLGLLVVAGLGVVLFADANAYKPQMEAAASQALGMEVKIDGPVGIGLFPGLVVTLRDLHVRAHGVEVVTIDEARLRIGVWSLLRKQLEIETLALKHPTLLVEQAADGSYALVQGTAPGGNPSASSLGRVTLADGGFRYVDKHSGNEVDADGCDVDIRALQLAAGKPSDILRGLGFTAVLACRTLRDGLYVATDIKAVANARQGLITLAPIGLQLFGVKGNGSFRADYSGAVPGYALRFSLPQFQIAEFFKTLSAQDVAAGRMDFSMQLGFRGTATADMTRSLAGRFSLRGKDLTLKGRDLDAEFSRFESSQHFNLVDLGALFFAGPIGLVVTKGYNFANVLRGPAGSSAIPVLVSDWKIQQGVAQPQDVALTTKLHRLALTGRLDFNSGKFDAVTLALIDPQGCAIVKQRITGSFLQPVVEQPNFIVALTGPVLKLIKMGRDLFPGGECEVFYAGSVAAPAPASIGTH